MLEIEQAPLFDYASLDTDTRTFLREQEAELECVLKRTSEDIGTILLRVKGRLPHGKYMPWLASKGISQKTAWRCMQVAQGKGAKKSVILTDLPLPALHEVEQEPAIQQETMTPQQFFTSVAPGFVLPESWKLPPEMRGEPPVMKSATLTTLQSSESTEWFTPAAYVEAARALMGAIDIDPASCEEANKIVQAARFYTRQENGLTQSWAGRVWLNPPYGLENGVSNQETWTRQLIERHAAGLIKEAVLLVNANTEAKWFQPLYDYPLCFTNHRICFYNQRGESSQPTQGNAFVYFGRQEQRFVDLFSPFGVIMRRVG